MTYRLQYRLATPKGNPGKVEWDDNLTLDDLQFKLTELLPKTCWIHVERLDLEFKGKTVTTEELAAARLKKGRK